MFLVDENFIAESLQEEVHDVQFFGDSRLYSLPSLVLMKELQVPFFLSFCEKVCCVSTETGLGGLQ